MATSGTINSSQTAGDIILDALRELRVYSGTETLSSADSTFGIQRLNWMLKQWQDDGLTSWRLAEESLTFAAGTAEKATSPRLLDVQEARVVMGDYERPLTRMEWGQFASYPNKFQEGSPTIFVVRPGRDTFSLRLWPVPSEDVTINYSGTRVIEDVTATSQTLDVPQQWTRTVMMNLAANLAPAFGKAADPNGVFVIREAARLYQLMRAADRPASYFFQGGQCA